MCFFFDSLSPISWISEQILVIKYLSLNMPYFWEVTIEFKHGFSKKFTEFPGHLQTRDKLGLTGDDVLSRFHVLPKHPVKKLSPNRVFTFGFLD